MKGKRVGEGRTAEVYEYGEGAVLKLFREDIPYGDVDREYEVSKYVYEQGIRTPRPMELTIVEGRKGIAFQQIHGRSLLKLISEKPWRIGQYTGTLAELHYSLHQSVGAAEFVRQKDMLKRNIIAAPMLTMEEKSAILDKLDKLPEGNRLCHGDYHPDNVLVDDRAWIIDWMNGITGDPAGDVARSMVLYSMGSMPPGSSLVSKLVIGFVRQRLTKGYIREYLRRSGMAYSTINAWVLPVAAARLTEGIPLSEKQNLVREIRRRLRKGAPS